MTASWLPQVLRKLGGGLSPGHQQLIPGSGTSHVEQMALGVADLVELGFIARGFDP
jgi:hypothetical protein